RSLRLRLLPPLIPSHPNRPRVRPTRPFLDASGLKKNSLRFVRKIGQQFRSSTSLCRLQIPTAAISPSVLHVLIVSRPRARAFAIALCVFPRLSTVHRLESLL